MSEKAKNEVQELSESEMSQVSGGSGMPGASSFMVKGVEVDCNLSYEYFEGYYRQGLNNACGGYSANKQISQKADMHCCESCQYFSPQYGYGWVHVIPNQGLADRPTQLTGGSGGDITVG